jgi:hypothetical protein
MGKAHALQARASKGYPVTTEFRRSHSTFIPSGVKFLPQFAPSPWDNEVFNQNLNTQYKTRPDDDGDLTIGEARYWWKYGNGDPLYIDINTLDFSSVDFNKFSTTKLRYHGDPMIQVNFAGNEMVNIKQAIIYGTISLVKDGSWIYALPDTFNFDIKNAKGSFVRDVLTGALLINFGFGTRFKIIFYGTVQ